MKADLLERLKAWRGEPDEWPMSGQSYPSTETGEEVEVVVPPNVADALVAVTEALEAAVDHANRLEAGEYAQDSYHRLAAARQEAHAVLERLLEGE